MSNFKSYFTSNKINTSDDMLEKLIINDGCCEPTKDDFDNYIKNSIKKYRDQHLAHYDICNNLDKEKRLKNYPDLSLAKHVVMNYYKLLFDMCNELVDVTSSNNGLFVFYSQSDFTSIFEDESIQIGKIFETQFQRPQRIIDHFR